ncbi:two component transcriptional regulator, LuxR family [Blastococcus aurantiacus]|uniref:Two component transcriptional regulator, LuxR family n=1 Tax=Blastococcus aurantiacus TaxID=1550231 RepID=A0A1G7I0W4_9ACTN|nr:response regulator transcription factor [Blastococcus aurantiacus]SDF06390.1 two component transcriptional regulator, LuxR family [Blastococcus aurantiacus]
MIRVVIADDHPAFRAGLRLLLEDSGLDVVAEAADGLAAVDAVVTTGPDVALLDLQMPGMTGVEVTRRLHEVAPATKVLVLTMIEADETVLAAIRAGAWGYLLKGAGQEEIERAVRSVADGQVVYGTGVAERVMGFLSVRSGSSVTPFPQLSDREREVLRLVSEGRANADIARRLFLSEKTVRNHVSSIFTKLDVPDRASAVARARDAGLGGQPGSAPID